MIINFAQNSHIDIGYQILERCVLHGHDPRMQSLFYNTANNLIQTEDGSIGMVIDAKVPASMRSAIYNNTIALTAKDILAVEYNCKSGSKGDDRVVCVHRFLY